MQQILTERHSGKTNQMTNWSVLTFKGKLKFFPFKHVIVTIIMVLVLLQGFIGYKQGAVTPKRT